MSLWKNYYIARTVEDALEVIEGSSGFCAIAAGGTDLFLELQQGKRAPVDTIVDITEIPQMCSIEILNGELFIGAAVNHRRINQSKLINEHCSALSKASGLIGGPQVRNVATIGGNVAHALPAADGTIALMALDACAEVVNSQGKIRLPLVELFLGPGKSVLNFSPAILTGFYLNLRKHGQGSAFRRIMRPQGVAIAILNMAVWIDRSGDLIKDLRISIGPSGPVPRRMGLAEEVLRGKKLTDLLMTEAHNVILDEAKFRTSKYRATKEYRQEMSKVLLKETIQEAIEDSRR